MWTQPPYLLSGSITITYATELPLLRTGPAMVQYISYPGKIKPVLGDHFKCHQKMVVPQNKWLHIGGTCIINLLSQKKEESYQTTFFQDR